MGQYEAIAPPLKKRFREMSTAEVKIYCSWFLQAIPERIRLLERAVRATSTYGTWRADYTTASLYPLGDWFAQQAETRKRTPQEREAIYQNSPAWFRAVEISDSALTSRTLSLAVDIGMYVGEVFVHNLPTAHWHCVTKGSRRFVDYGQPVVGGFGKNICFNPVQMLTTLAYGLVDKTKTGRSLRQLYDTWEEMAERDQLQKDQS